MRAVAAYFPATLVTYLLGSLLSTLIIMAGLADLGMPVTFGDVVSAVLFDWLGLLGAYLPLVALSLLIALPVAAQLYRRLGLPHRDLCPCRLRRPGRPAPDYGGDPGPDRFCCSQVHLWPAAAGPGWGNGRLVLRSVLQGSGMTEPELFQEGIAALQAGRGREARSIFQQAVDADIATARCWLGLALAALVDADVPAAEVAVDAVLREEPHNMRALIIKGDIMLGKDDFQGASAHYNLVLRLAATLPEVPKQLASDLGRIQSPATTGRYFPATPQRPPCRGRVQKGSRLLPASTSPWTCCWARNSARIRGRPIPRPPTCSSWLTWVTTPIFPRSSCLDEGSRGTHRPH